jgi:hypothetical protein
MQFRKITILCLLFSSVMIVFGLLYEQIVFIPNFFIDNSIEAKKLFNQFHLITNPIHYHMLPSTLSVICIIILWTTKNNSLVTRNMAIISIGTITVIFLTVFVVLNVNTKLFFDEPLNKIEDLKSLAIYWSVINISRITILLFCIFEIIKLYSTFKSFARHIQ